MFEVVTIHCKTRTLVQLAAIKPFIDAYGTPAQQMERHQVNSAMLVTDVEGALLLWPFICRFGADDQRLRLAECLRHNNIVPPLTMDSLVGEMPELDGWMAMRFRQSGYHTIGKLTTLTKAAAGRIIAGRRSTADAQKLRVLFTTMKKHGFFFQDGEQAPS